LATQQHEVYGISFETPHIPPKLEIGGYELRKPEQKFRRVELPKSFYNVEFDDDGNGLYNDEQYAFIEQQQYHIEHGYWFYNYGEPTYITGLNYFYLNFWRLENNDRPDYRDADRKWFYFQHYCESQKFIDGIIRVKKRREGATSQAACSLVYDAIMQEKAFCGIVSKSGKDAKDAFIYMVANGYKSLPDFLKVRCENENSKTELLFSEHGSKKHKKEKKKGQMFSDSLGLGSRIDWRATETSSYDSGRLTKLLLDEGAKFPVEVAIDEYWPIVQKTMKQGLRRVGFALMPSTTNRGEKGGTGFRKLWDDSNHNEGTRTGSGLYRYFAPADEGFEGYIDEYGMSILAKPTPEQAKWMRKHYGLGDLECGMSAREYIVYKRSLIKNPVALKKEILDYPLSEKEAFDFSEDDNIYNTLLLNEQKDYLISKNLKFRKVRFYETHEKKVDFADDPNGDWLILYLPKEEERNLVTERAGKKTGGNIHKYVISVDPFKSTIKVGPGSKGAALIWSKPSELDPENTGMPVAMYYGRPKLRNTFHDQMMYAARYYGAELFYESDYDDYIEYFMNLGYFGYVKEKPKNAIDPNRKRTTMKQYGAKSADSFALSSMISASIEYVERRCHQLYFMELVEDLLSYDHDKRTDHDLAVAFQLGCLAIQAPIKQKKEVKKTSVLRTFDLTKRLN
jgi:hypothetical protein